MNIFDTFSNNAPNKVFFSIISGASAGIAYALLIPTLITSLDNGSGELAIKEEEVTSFLWFEVADFKIAAFFLFTCLFILVARTYSQVTLLRVSMDVTAQLRIKLYERISGTSIDNLERVGSPKLIANITTDVGRIVDGGRVLPDFIMNIATLLGLLCSLALLNPDVFWFVLKTIAFGVITYQLPILLGDRYLGQARESIDHLHESIRALIYGSKELKLDQNKRKTFFDSVLVENEMSVLRSEKKGHSVISAATSYGDLICFFVIGVVAFVLTNYQTISQAELVSVIMVLLYITTPVAVIIDFVPAVMQAKISLNKINNLFKELPEEPISLEVMELPEWNAIEYENVTYQHKSKQEQSGFTVGPASFVIKKGEITFIVGGNGSGKSTLSKIITLHYPAHTGTINFGSLQVSPETLTSCRLCISAIFSDYYLFDRLLGIIDKEQVENVEQYLKDLDLIDKVTVDNGQFSTTSLSDGQRRRLALLVAYLDDKDVYVFDEWAADQDPEFKDIFYLRILPELKKRNKAVVVISHDDRFFEVADQILVMEDGQLTRTSRTKDCSQVA